MPKFEYVVTKLSVQDNKAATEELNRWGAKGYEFKFATVKDSRVITILQKVNISKPKPRPKKAK